MHPIVKRLILPAGVLLLVVHVITWGERIEPIMPDGASVLPGEALDPLAKTRMRHPHDRRPENAFESVLRSAVDAEEQADLKANNSPLVSSSLPGGKEEAVLKKPTRSKKETTAEKKETSAAKKETKTKKGSSSHGGQKAKDGGHESVHDAEWSMSKANIPGHEKVKFEGHAINERTVTLTIMSSSDKVFMSLNKMEIYRGLEDRGMHVVVLHPHTGKVMAARVFDTFHNGTENDMVEFIENLQSGRIAVFAIRDEAATGLTWKGRNKLKDVGARFADRIAYRDMWILVTRIGGLKLAESYSNVAKEDTEYEWGGPLFLRTDFDLQETSDTCNWPDDYQEEMRQRFCQRFEGYGNLCKCSVHQFDDVFFKTDPKVSQALAKTALRHDLAVAVLATDRPHYLFRTLKALREAPGVKLDRVVVFIEREHKEIQTLVKLFSMQLVITGQRAEDNVTTTVRVRDKIQHIFRELMGATFPDSQVPEGMNKPSPIPPLSCSHLLLLDEDVQVSVDFFKYLHALAPVLERDPTVLGISAFNYNSYSVVSNSLTDFYRTGRLQKIALMIPARTLHDHVMPHWPSMSSKENWHVGLEDALQRDSSLALLYPEVSRCLHFGYTGFRIQGSLQYDFFATHKMAMTTNYEIPQENIDRLELAAFDAWQLSTVKNSVAMSYDFCKYSNTYGDEPYVVYVKYDGIMSHDMDLTATLKCLGAWYLYGEGDWRSTWHFHYHGHPLTLAAVPASPYSHLMPADYKFTDMTDTNKSATVSK